MKRSVALLAFILLISFNQFGQSGWFWQNPKPEGNTLNDVAIFGTNYAIAVGNLGLILRSEDKGETWSKVSSGTTNNLYGVSMFQNGTGWAAGANGTVLKTTDNGQTWVKQTTGNYFSYYSVATNDGVRCFVGGYSGTLYISSDGGSNWSARPTNSVKAIRSIYTFFNELIYLAYDDGGIQKSVDSGDTWLTLPSPLTTPINKITFSGVTGFAVGDGGKVLKTTSSGTSWTPISITDPFDLKTVAILDPARILIMGGSGQVLTSSNGGDSFTASYPITHIIPFFNAVAVIPDQLYLSVGNYGLIAKSTNGIDWNVATNGSLEQAWDVWFTSADRGFVLGSIGGIMKTVDGGANWVRNQRIALSTDFRSLCFVSDRVGFAGCNMHLYKTTDSGETWISVLDYLSVPALTGTVMSIFFLDPDVGWMVTSTGNTYRTFDCGKNWELHPSGVTKNLYCVRFKDRLNGFITGANGTFLTTTDGGLIWNKVDNSITGTLTSMHIIDLQNIIVAGFNGKVFKTSDGGLTWHPVALPARAGSNHLWKMRFVDNLTGWICGEYGVILKTNDGGVTWSSQVSNVSHSLFSIYFTDANTGWAVGHGGTVIKTLDGGGSSSVVNLETGRSGFILRQNYPNPFDQRTTLAYYVPKRSSVKLEIYSVTGSKITTLLEGSREAGRHEAIFDASGLPCGIYFCRYSWGAGEGVSIRLLKN